MTWHSDWKRWWLSGLVLYFAELGTHKMQVFLYMEIGTKNVILTLSMYIITKASACSFSSQLFSTVANNI